MNIQELIQIISEVENKQLRNYSKDLNRYDIAPIDSDGSPVNDASARPTIVFKVFEDEIALQWLYLNTQNQGLGTSIVQWLVEYSRFKGISKMSIRLVEENNASMIALARKFGFEVSESIGEKLNFELFL